MYLLFTSRSAIRLAMEGHADETTMPNPVPQAAFFALLQQLVTPYVIQNSLTQANIMNYLYELNAPVPGTLASARNYRSNVTADPAKIRKAFDITIYTDDNPCPGAATTITPDDQYAIFLLISHGL